MSLPDYHHLCLKNQEKEAILYFSNLLHAPTLFSKIPLPHTNAHRLTVDQLGDKTEALPPLFMVLW